jgi:glucan phosphoethanolaminetransferase (alkaline phosphatase superfamily)
LPQLRQPEVVEVAAVRQAQILWVLRVVLVVALLLSILRVAQEAALQTKAMLAAHMEVILFMVLAVVAVQAALAATGTTTTEALGVLVFHPVLTEHQLAALAVVAVALQVRVEAQQVEVARE